MKYLIFSLLSSFILTTPLHGQSARQLEQWRKRFPAADLNGDGKLTVEEAKTIRKRMFGGAGKKIHPGWKKDRFPDHAVCYKTPEEIQAIYGTETPVHPPSDRGVLRIAGIGHSFMTPGYRTLPRICRAAGFEQPLFTHTSGGSKGSARYKWEEENGIFQHDGKPKPKILAALSTGAWDVMMWGPYFNHQPAEYKAWMTFALKYNPEMDFYLSDAWPSLRRLDRLITSEEQLTLDVYEELSRESDERHTELIQAIDKAFPGKVHIMPTSDAMMAVLRLYYQGKLPGIEGINRSIGKKKRSIWVDTLGHLGPGFDWLEGYVFYASVYQRSPEKLNAISGDQKLPDPKLDTIFRRVAWEAVINNPLSDVTDRNGNGIGDGIE